MEIKARDLLAAGWQEGPRMGATLRRARELETSGLERADMLAQLEQEHPKVIPCVLPREKPAPLVEALSADTEAAVANLAACRQRMAELLRMPVIEAGALMPDACPASRDTATIPVGGAIAVRNAIIPGAHSADICCSMYASFFPATHPVREMMDHLEKVTHFGAGGRPRGQQWQSAVLDEPVWENPFLSGLQSRARDFLGTQGDGNHFAYLGKVHFDEAGIQTLIQAGHVGLAEEIGRHGPDFQVLVTHHGSRGLGADVYKRGQKAARAWCDHNAQGIPDAAAWIPYDTEAGQAYWEALQYVARWTRENHAILHRHFLSRLGLTASFSLGNEHNFVWKRGERFLHGKGATPAWTDTEGRPLIGIIPLNMGREILLVLGNDRPDTLSFCPHGAGRNQSRTATLRPFKDADGNIDPAVVRRVLEEHAPGIDVRWFSGTADLSESPIAYKDASKVKQEIREQGLATLFAEIQPLGCIMAGEADEQPWQKARREKRAAHKALRREADSELREDLL